MRFFLCIASVAFLDLRAEGSRLNFNAFVDDAAPNDLTDPRLETGHVFLAVLLRIGKRGVSTDRVRSIKKTWARDLEPGSLVELQADEDCKRKYGDNHWRGLTCLEAKAHMRLMNHTTFDWLLVVDDDAYVFADRLRDTLRGVDQNRAEVYGVPGCGKCVNSPDGLVRTGFCGGGGYILSRHSLLKMAGAEQAPVSIAAGEAFLQHMMTEPNMEWCDVRFGCVAQEKGLKAVLVKGLYGNGVVNSDMKFDKKEEKNVVGLESEEPPLVVHIVRDDLHMERLYEESNLEKAQNKGVNTYYASLAAWQGQ